MNVRHTFLAALALLVIATGGCDSDAAISARECSLDVGPQMVTLDATVSYAVTLTGEGQVDSITYQFGQDSQTVSNPTLPWSATRNVAVDKDVSMTARGRVTDGRISLRLEAVGAQGGSEITLTLSDECVQTL